MKPLWHCLCFIDCRTKATCHMSSHKQTECARDTVSTLIHIGSISSFCCWLHISYTDMSVINVFTNNSQQESLTYYTTKAFLHSRWPLLSAPYRKWHRLWWWVVQSTGSHPAPLLHTCMHRHKREGCCLIILIEEQIWVEFSKQWCRK